MFFIEGFAGKGLAVSLTGCEMVQVSSIITSLRLECTFNPAFMIVVSTYVLICTLGGDNSDGFEDDYGEYVSQDTGGWVDALFGGRSLVVFLGQYLFVVAVLNIFGMEEIGWGRKEGKEEKEGEERRVEVA